MGPFSCVVLNGYDLISETLLHHHENLLGWPKYFVHEENSYTGIVSLTGHRWKEQRAFLQSTLRNLGMGRRIKREADYLLATINKAKGEPTDINNLVTVCVNNVVSGITFGKRFDLEDETIVYWLNLVRRLFKLLASSASIDFFPVLKYLPGDLFHYKELKYSIFHQIKKTMLDWMEKDMRKINVSDQSFEDIVQAFLTEIKRKKLQGVTDLSIEDKNLQETLFSLFNAGAESTTNTIVFAVLYMINFPDIQAKLYQEIKDVVGMNRTPDVSDKSKLKFLSAFIMETQRFAGVVPLGIDRLATSDIQLGGYTITKGTTVMVNLDSALRDVSAWGDPDVFRPDRFIDDKGSVVVKKDFLPFGIGKRNCLGEGLATMELFIFISALVQKFEFLSENEAQLPSMESDVGFTRVTKAFKIIAIRRFE